MKRSLILLPSALASLGSTPATAWAQSQPPATRRAREVVTLINSGTPATIRAYVDSAFALGMRGMPMSAHLNFMMGQRERSRGLDWVEVQEEAANSATALLRQKLTGDLIAVLVRVEPSAPYQVNGIGQRPPRPKAGTAAPRVVTDADMVASLRQYVDALAQADVFSGTVLLAKDGKVLYSAAFGQANKDFGASNKLDTKFNITVPESL